ncbi:hypothetical protein PTTG_07321, partial [Puccinia triticina 1-1 BBBD Race 1]
MAETSQQNSTSDTVSVQPQENGFKELESALPPLQEDFITFPKQADTGIPPALYQARETSLALALSRSMPVLHSVDREQLIITASQQPSQPNPEGMRPTALSTLALLLYTQIPEDEELTSLITWGGAQNTQTMRCLLSQASLTQEMIIDLVGREDMIRLCQEWILRDKLNILEISLADQTNGKELLIIWPPLQLAIVPHSRVPPSNHQEFCPPPQQLPCFESQAYHGPQIPPRLPPPLPQQPLQVRPPPAAIPQGLVQLFRYQPYHQPGAYNQQPLKQEKRRGGISGFLGI